MDTWSFRVLACCRSHMVPGVNLVVGQAEFWKGAITCVRALVCELGENRSVLDIDIGYFLHICSIKRFY